MRYLSLVSLAAVPDPTTRSERRWAIRSPLNHLDSALSSAENHIAPGAFSRWCLINVWHGMLPSNFRFRVPSCVLTFSNVERV